MEQVFDGISTCSHGILTEWYDDKGYGFITPDHGGEKVFLHVKSLQNFARRPVQGERFYYHLLPDKQGRPRAAEAFQTILDEKRRIPFLHSIVNAVTYLWPLAVIPYLYLVISNDRSVGVLCLLYVVNSMLTFLFYREDKYRANYKFWRIKERTLHLWELLGGWPGALLAQFICRHKKRKIRFLLVCWLCIVVNISVLYMILHGIGNGQLLSGF